MAARGRAELKNHYPTLYI